MERRSQPPKAGYQIPKKPAAKKEEESLIELYKESELTKKPEEIQKAKKEKPVKNKQEKSQNSQLKNLLKIAIPCGMLAAVLVVLSFSWLIPKVRENKGEDISTTTEPDKIFYSKLTGREIQENEQSLPTTCIMIENSQDARPQSGLDQAGIVYEAIAEGGITRFMAVYQEAKPQYIGPVRSVRMAYAQIARSYNCSIAHVGGADNALNLIRNNPEYRDIDQFFNDDYYWRIDTRWAPHNVYTSFESLDKLNSYRQYTTSDFAGFTRIQPGANISTENITASKINIEVSSSIFNPVYTYNQANNNYLRAYEDGEVHEVIDQNGTTSQLSPDVVIAIEAGTVARPGSDYADYQVIGSGRAYVFQNGTVTVGQWTRNSETEEFNFIDESGTTIALNRGQTWITIYPTGNSVTWE